MERKSRNTKQKELLQEECSTFKEFFTAEDLFKKVKQKDLSIGIATVYRFLKEIKKNKKVFTYICDRKVLYSKEKNSHCHYICEKTGKVIHFEIDNIDFLKKVKEKIPGSITSFQLEVKGVCKDCHK
jgi:Fe2+ or Zn2+ uptake regulation protein